MKSSYLQSALLSVCTLASACAPGERLNQPVPTSPRPRTAAARDITFDRSRDARTLAWEDAGRRALRAGLAIGASFHERISFPSDPPLAVAYRFTLRRGQSLHVQLRAVNGAALPVAEMFEVVTDDMIIPAPPLAASGSELTFSAHADAQYALRLQPRPGTGGVFDVTVSGGRALLFPVAGAGTASIGSWFGDARDGGVRAHEGVDIFAPRSTPVLAVAPAYVTSTQPTAAGGNVIWLEDEAGGMSYYYAHLDERRVVEGQHVAMGDTIGAVGNTGNARAVSPHLHFSVYLPGRIAVDPAPMLATAPLGEPITDRALLGRWTRLAGDRVRLRATPSLAGAILAELRANTPLLVIGGVSDWQRVMLRDGTTGFVAARYTDVQDLPLDGRSP